MYQDSGRHGWHHLGLTTGGPMDRQAQRWANRLCQNGEHCAVLEVTFGGLVLEALIDTSIAITGADIPIYIDGIPAAAWQTQHVARGQRIQLDMATTGLRGYLAVAGGFNGRPTFGSLACVPREHLGGHRADGSALQSGDILQCSAPGKLLYCLHLTADKRPPKSPQSALLRVILSYQAWAFSRQQQQLFFSGDYRLTENSDRMGARLTGPAIEPHVTDILSEGVCLGAVQVPSDGQPIILLSDRQTIGGYAKIGAVLSLDLDRLAQQTPGNRINFECISMEQAHSALLLAERKFLATELARV